MELSRTGSLIPLVGLVGLIFAGLTYVGVKRLPPGNASMIEIADAIHQGAMVFLKREYQIVAAFIIVVFAVLTTFLGIWTGVAFVAGGICSMLAGLFGMEAATRTSSRACYGAIAGGTPAALSIAFRGGSVMGISVAAIGVIGLGIFFACTHDPIIISGFAMGASSIALFARVGGGIYTKAADVGADLAGKLEAGIPEDDPRNPAVIADNVGDCVGDTAGMGADLFESYVGSVVAAMAIGASLSDPLRWMALPLVLITIGLVASMLGILSIGLLKRIDPQAALRYATYVSAILFVIGAYVTVRWILGQLDAFWAILAGLAAGVLIGLESEYYTSGPPIKGIAQSSTAGPATTIITGLAVGFESTILPLITLCGAIFIAYQVGQLYGIAIAAVGMLSTIGIVMSTDSYGPIADNAGGIAEMSGAGVEVRRQFRDVKGLLEGTARADSGACNDIVTQGALREMILPGLLAVVAPLIVGFVMGPESLGGFLAGATACGVPLGIMMVNGGAAWDNAKKWIEADNLGGKGSETHRAAVVGDTVGDPFKDTTGPSMNILIKLMAIVSLVCAPLLG